MQMCKKKGKAVSSGTESNRLLFGAQELLL